MTLAWLFLTEYSDRLTANFAQLGTQYPPVKTIQHINQSSTNTNSYHHHGHHRNLLHSCLLFSDSTRRFSGFLDQVQHQQHHQQQAAQRPFGQPHGVYSYQA